MAKATTISDSTFEEEVLKSDVPVLVDFWAEWCGPCRMVAPELEKIAQKYGDSIDVVKMDVDANPGVSQALQIMTLPTIAFFRPGQQPMAVVGAMPAEQFEARFGLSQYAKSPS